MTHRPAPMPAPHGEMAHICWQTSARNGQGAATQTEPSQVSGLPMARIRWHRTARCMIEGWGRRASIAPSGGCRPGLSDSGGSSPATRSKPRGAVPPSPIGVPEHHLRRTCTRSRGPARRTGPRSRTARGPQHATAATGEKPQLLERNGLGPPGTPAPSHPRQRAK
jgi:hypothetical protein